MVDTTQREQIRTAVATHRTAAQRMRDQVVDETVKRQLDQVVRDLDDVERVFLNDTRQDRTPEQELYWLGYAAKGIDVAVERLRSRNEMVQASGGPDKVRSRL
jgi:hypothetical protein